MEQSEICQALERSEFFRGLQKADIERIAGLCRVKSYEPGQYIFQQGEGGENILVLAEGKVALERTVELGSRKGTVLIGILGKGRLFGCWSTADRGTAQFLVFRVLSASHESACAEGGGPATGHAPEHSPRFQGSRETLLRAPRQNPGRLRRHGENLISGATASHDA